MLEFKSYVDTVKLSDITPDDKLQMRSSGLNQNHLDSLIAALEDGGKIKEPIRLVKLPDGRLVIVDGFHRYAAHQQAGRRVIRAYIAEDGTFEDALAYAEAANLEHGLSLSSKDRKQILFQRLDRDHVERLDDGDEVVWLKLSNGFLASLLGVNSRTIARWMSEYLQGSQHPDEIRRFVIGRDGREIDTGAIVQANVERTSDTPVTDSGNAPPSPPKHGGGEEQPSDEATGANVPVKSSEGVTFSDEELAILSEFIEIYDQHGKDWLPLQIAFPLSQNPDFRAVHDKLRLLCHEKGAIAKHSIKEAYRPLNPIEMKLLGVILPEKVGDPVVVVPSSDNGQPHRAVPTQPENGSEAQNQALVYRAKLEKAALELIMAAKQFSQIKGVNQFEHLLEMDGDPVLKTWELLDKDVRGALLEATDNMQSLSDKLIAMRSVDDPPKRVAELLDEPTNYEELVVIGPEVAGFLQKHLLTLRSYLQEIFGDDDFVHAAAWVQGKIKGMTFGVKARPDQLTQDEAGRLVNMLMAEYADELDPLKDEPSPDDERDTTPFDPDSPSDRARVRKKMNWEAQRRFGSGRLGITLGNENGNGHQKRKYTSLTFVFDNGRTAREKRLVTSIDVDEAQKVWYVCDEDGNRFGYQSTTKQPGMNKLRGLIDLSTGTANVQAAGLEIEASIGEAGHKDAPCDEVFQLMITQVEVVANG